MPAPRARRHHGGADDDGADDGLRGVVPRRHLHVVEAAESASSPAAAPATIRMIARYAAAEPRCTTPVTSTAVPVEQAHAAAVGPLEAPVVDQRGLQTGDGLAGDEERGAERRGSDGRAARGRPDAVPERELGARGPRRGNSSA